MCSGSVAGKFRSRKLPGAQETRRGPERFATARLPRAEQILASGLLDWAEHLDRGNPEPNRGKPITP